MNLALCTTLLLLLTQSNAEAGARRVRVAQLAEINISGTPFGGNLRIGIADNGDVASFRFSSPWPGTATVNEPIAGMMKGKRLVIRGRKEKKMGEAALRTDLPFNPSVGGTFRLSFLNCQNRMVPMDVRLERDPATNRWRGTHAGKIVRTVLLDGPVITKGCISGVRTR